MCCIELIEDFTQNYSAKEFRIVVRKKAEGQYFEGLRKFLLRYYTCLLYTSDAADERSSVDLGGRRIIKKKTQHKHVEALQK